jgi:rubrerythrin
MPPAVTGRRDLLRGSPLDVALSPLFQAGDWLCYSIWQVPVVRRGAANVHGYLCARRRALWAVREAVQAELDAFLFYKLARDQARHWEQRAVLERLCEAEMSVLNDLEKQYHPHLATRVLELPVDEQNRLAQRLFRGICLSDHSAVRDLYHAALAMERHSRDRFRVLAEHLPDSAERKVCAELADKDEAHVALLEAELGLLAQAAN